MTDTMADTFAEHGGAPCLSSQNMLFPTHHAYASDTALEDFYDRLNDQLFAIQDDILYACITYGEGLESSLIEGVTHTKLGLGYPLLAFFASQALGLYRLPFCPDRSFARVPRGFQRDDERLQEILRCLSPTRVDSICAEVRALYQHTQRLLKEASLETVHLKRCVDNSSDRYSDRSRRYAELLFRLKTASEFVGCKSLRFEMDVLNSYGDDSGYSGLPVIIRQEIPADQILYCANFIRSRAKNYHGSPEPSVEDGEWVVINPANDGIVELPTSAIELNNAEWIDRFGDNTFDQESAERFIADWDPIVLDGLAVLRPAHRFNGADLRLRPLKRLYYAYQILRTGRPAAI